MKIRRRQLVGDFLVVLGVVLIIVGFMMPYYKSPQRLKGAGPGIQFSANRSYWINNYVMPPIDAGQPISLNLLSDKQGATVILLSLYDSESGRAMGEPLLHRRLSQYERGIVFFATATKSGPYLLMITSYNSSYTFYLDSVWSPYYELRASRVFGIGILPVGLVILYYDELMEKREKMIEDAMRDIRKSP